MSSGTGNVVTRPALHDGGMEANLVGQHKLFPGADEATLQIEVEEERAVYLLPIIHSFCVQLKYKSADGEVDL